MLSNRAETKVSKFSGQLQGSQPLARQKTLASMSIEIIKDANYSMSILMGHVRNRAKRDSRQ